MLKPVRKFDRKKLEKSLKRHLNSIRELRDLKEPKPGELATTYLEEEFEN